MSIYDYIRTCVYNIDYICIYPVIYVLWVVYILTIRDILLEKKQTIVLFLKALASLNLNL